MVKLVAVLLLCSSAAAAVDCRTAMPAHSSKEHWTWRLVDGRRCWFAGDRAVDKVRLHWGEARPMRQARAAEPAVVAEPEPGLLEAPPPTPVATFADRWQLASAADQPLALPPASPVAPIESSTPTGVVLVLIVLGLGFGALPAWLRNQKGGIL